MVVLRKNLKPLPLLGFTLRPPPNIANSTDINLDTENCNLPVVTGLFSHDVTLIDINPHNIFSSPSRKKSVVHTKNLKPLALRAFTLVPPPNGTSSSGINLDIERLHEPTPFMDIYNSRLHSFWLLFFGHARQKKKSPAVQNGKSTYCPRSTRISSRPTQRTDSFSVPTYSDFVG